MIPADRPRLSGRTHRYDRSDARLEGLRAVIGLKRDRRLSRIPYGVAKESRISSLYGAGDHVLDARAPSYPGVSATSLFVRAACTPLPADPGASRRASIA